LNNISDRQLFNIKDSELLDQALASYTADKKNGLGEAHRYIAAGEDKLFNVDLEKKELIPSMDIHILY
jgi:hypothetical protein